MYFMSRLKPFVLATILSGKSVSETFSKIGQSTTNLHNGHLAAFALMMHVENHLSAHSICIVCPHSIFSTLLSWSSGSKHTGQDSSLETSPEGAPEGQQTCLDIFLQHQPVTSRFGMYSCGTDFIYSIVESSDSISILCILQTSFLDSVNSTKCFFKLFLMKTWSSVLNTFWYFITRFYNEEIAISGSPVAYIQCRFWGVGHSLLCILADDLMIVVIWLKTPKYVAEHCARAGHAVQDQVFESVFFEKLDIHVSARGRVQGERANVLSLICQFENEF